jgi:hypothetical protein
MLISWGETIRYTKKDISTRRADQAPGLCQADEALAERRDLTGRFCFFPPNNY